MSSRSRLTTAIVVALALLASAPQVGAGGVDNQRQEVERIADQLDSLANRIGQLDEDYGAAQDKKVTLDAEIVELQAQVDAQQGELSVLQQKLTDIALDRFTASGSGALSPLLSTAEAFADSQQKQAMQAVALEDGTENADDIEAQVTQLEKQQTQLADKQAEAAQLMSYLDAKKAEAEQLEVDYQQQYTAAQARLGDLITQEQERRAAAAAAEAAAAWNAANAPTTGGGTGGGNGGGNGGGTTATPDEPIRGGGASTPSAAPTVSAPKASAPPVSGRAGTALNAAYAQLGVPYRFAAESPGVAFDCSGLTKYAWGQAGVYLPHQSRAQFAATPRISRDEIQPGDLIFYYSPIGHVGMYVGGGSLIHAPQTGDVVKISGVNWGKVVGVTRPG